MRAAAQSVNYNLDADEYDMGWEDDEAGSDGSPSAKEEEQDSEWEEKGRKRQGRGAQARGAVSQQLRAPVGRLVLCACYFLSLLMLNVSACWKRLGMITGMLQYQCERAGLNCSLI